MKLSEELTARGFIHQFSAPTLAEIIDGPARTIYHGIDPTADSAHAGNFVNWMLLRHLVQAGHKVIFLVGGGTGMIGDPKPDAERQLLDADTITVRVKKLREQAARLLGGEITFVNNHDWLSSLHLIPFLRDIGKHFTVNELIKKDAIASRLSGEAGLSYTEFAYPLLQAYDFLTLFRTHGCEVQVGGSDQWGNMIAGVDLIRRLDQAAAHAITVPLVIDKTTGKKFGKSEGNAVWLDAEKTTPYQFYQFWFNTADENVINYLKLFTLLPLEEINQMERDLLQNPGARQAQRLLAEEATALVHGKEVTRVVCRVSECLFGETSVNDLSEEERALLKENAPLVTAPEGVSLVDLLVMGQLASSKREARTFIESGAIMVAGVKVEDPNYTLIHQNTGPLFKLQRGKKQLVVVEIA